MKNKSHVRVAIWCRQLVSSSRLDTDNCWPCLTSVLIVECRLLLEFDLRPCDKHVVHCETLWHLALFSPLRRLGTCAMNARSNKPKQNSLSKSENATGNPRASWQHERNWRGSKIEHSQVVTIRIKVNNLSTCFDYCVYFSYWSGAGEGKLVPL